MNIDPRISVKASSSSARCGSASTGTPRTLAAPRDFLAPGKYYISHRYAHDPTLTTRTRVRFDRIMITATTVPQIPLGATSREAIRITRIAHMAFQSLACGP